MGNRTIDTILATVCPRDHGNFSHPIDLHLITQRIVLWHDAESTPRLLTFVNLRSNIG